MIIVRVHNLIKQNHTRYVGMFLLWYFAHTDTIISGLYLICIQIRQLTETTTIIEIKIILYLGVLQLFLEEKYY